MVSLKSFKLIHEGEIDESDDLHTGTDGNFVINNQSSIFEQHNVATKPRFSSSSSNADKISSNTTRHMTSDTTSTIKTQASSSSGVTDQTSNYSKSTRQDDEPNSTDPLSRANGHKKGKNEENLTEISMHQQERKNELGTMSAITRLNSNQRVPTSRDNDSLPNTNRQFVAMSQELPTIDIVVPSSTTKMSEDDKMDEMAAKTTNIDIKSDLVDRKSSSSFTSSPVSIVVVKHSDERNKTFVMSDGATERVEGGLVGHSHIRASGDGSIGSDEMSDKIDNVSNEVPTTSDDSSSNQQSGTESLMSTGEGEACTGQIYRANLLAYPGNLKGQNPHVPPSVTTESRLSVTTESEHFEIVWSNLSYRIEPKWYKKFNFIDRALSHFALGQTVDSHSSATSTASSSANMNDDQHQMHNSDNQSNMAATKQKSSLDPIEIFSDLNGTIKSGQMTAVLGPSGAGKTTLLNCLTGKLRTGVSGHINLKGANGKHLKMCTIPQKDHLLEQLTVEENLWFASKIKNPEYGFDHAKNIERVIDLLGLKRCRSAKIKKISGGQHKRVSIAQELLSNPDILVLDEPTSGLDSLTCFKTISMLRDLVELSANNDFMKPMAIIVTIHQPQPKVFNLFHHVYILANGGRVIYEGAPENSLDTITKVTSLQPIDSSKSTSLTPGAVDPASFLIEIASEEYGVDVINTLSNYQRSNFHELNNNREARRQQKNDAICSYGIKQESGRCIYGQDNHSFTPDMENVSRKSKGCATIFIQSSNQQNNLSIEDTHAQKESNDQSKISYEQTNYQFVNNHQHKSSKCKRRKKSATDSRNSHCNETGSTHSINLGSQSLPDPNLYLSEQLLYTRVPNHTGRFWSHTATLTHRTLLTIRRDPLLMTSRVLFHLMIPILMGHVYGKSTGAANACPHYEPEIDITQIPSLVENKRIESMLEELHMSIENVSMFFIIMYAFAAAVLALNALSFPLNMQVLLKETRNGWYSMSSYVLAKTLADLPLELTMPCMTMLLVYPLTGQPSSYLQWRMLTICLIMTLCSLIAQTQALIVGALVMNSVQTAVFVSQASQLPWVILAGFTIRIKRLSEPLKVISLTSFYRLGCEAITLTRYGFGICPCDPQEITGEPVKLVGIPDQFRTMAQYWLDSIESSKANNDTVDGFLDDSSNANPIAITTTTLAPTVTTTKTDIFQHLANQLSYANSYGVNITSCDDVAPDRIRAINLGDNWLVARIWHLFIMLVIMKILLYYAVRFSIGIRL